LERKLSDRALHVPQSIGDVPIGNCPRYLLGVPSSEDAGLRQPSLSLLNIPPPDSRIGQEQHRQESTLPRLLWHFVRLNQLPFAFLQPPHEQLCHTNVPPGANSVQRQIESRELGLNGLERFDGSAEKGGIAVNADGLMGHPKLVPSQSLSCLATSSLLVPHGPLRHRGCPFVILEMALADALEIQAVSEQVEPPAGQPLNATRYEELLQNGCEPQCRTVFASGMSKNPRGDPQRV
jgi:hypothetical protein